MSTSLVSGKSAFASQHSDVKLFKELVNEMTSPVNLDGLNETVTIIPCAHKIQALVLKAQGKEACPQCKITMTGYLTNNQVESVRDKLSKMSEEFKVNIGCLKLGYQLT